MTFERDGTAASARKRVLTAIDDGEAHSIGDVVQTVVNGTASPSTTCEAIAQLFRTGEVYEPKPGQIKKTGGGSGE